MRICLDARGNHFGGVLTYTYSLLKEFSNINTQHNFIVLLDEYQVENDLFEIRNMEKIVTPVMGPSKILIWNNWNLPQLLKKKSIDIYHGFKHFTLRTGKTKLIFSLRSASWWLYPSLFKKRELIFWRAYYFLGAKRADCVLTTSEADKQIFVNVQKISSNKVKAIHQAPDKRFCKITDVEKLQHAKRKYNLPDEYILFVGTIYPFKNIETVISSYSFAKKLGNLSHKLVIVGGESKAFTDRYRFRLEELARHENVDKDIIWVGPVFEELPEIYTMADVFVFPSLYESYTKPPIEAMACGTPTIASGEGGLPEVVGNAAIIKGCKDVEGFAASIVDILKSNELQQDLTEKGHKQAASFSWKRCADETLETYYSIL